MTTHSIYIQTVLHIPRDVLRSVVFRPYRFFRKAYRLMVEEVDSDRVDFFR